MCAWNDHGLTSRPCRLSAKALQEEARVYVRLRHATRAGARVRPCVRRRRRGGRAVARASGPVPGGRLFQPRAGHARVRFIPGLFIPGLFIPCLFQARVRSIPTLRGTRTGEAFGGPLAQRGCSPQDCYAFVLSGVAGGPAVVCAAWQQARPRQHCADLPRCRESRSRPPSRAPPEALALLLPVPSILPASPLLCCVYCSGFVWSQLLTFPLPPPRSWVLDETTQAPPHLMPPQVAN